MSTKPILNPYLERKYFWAQQNKNLIYLHDRFASISLDSPEKEELADKICEKILSAHIFSYQLSELDLMDYAKNQ